MTDETTATEEQEGTFIAVGGKQYDLAKLPDNIRQLVVYFKRWEAELMDARLEVAKLEGAIRDVAAEIQKEITKLEQAVAPIE